MMWWGGKNLLCKLTLDGAFSLAIEIRFRLRRVLASKSPPIEKSTLVLCFRFEMVGRQGFAVSRKREPHGKNLLCKLTLGGAFSLAIEIRFRLRRVLASKSPPIEKSTLVLCFRFEMVGRQGFAVSRKREPHGKNLLCKLTLGGAFSLAIDIKFWLRRVLASKSHQCQPRIKQTLPKRRNFRVFCQILT